MTKELGIGGAIGALVFLIFLGYNVAPLILLMLLGAGIYYIALRNGGGLNKSNIHVGKNDTGIDFEQIGGQGSAIGEVKEALDFINKGKEINQLGIRPLKGILLTGPPGTGKTLLAKAAASYTDSTFLATSGSEFVEMYAGVGAQRVRKIFKEAVTKGKKEGKSSAIIFIDEIEVLGVKRGSNSSHMEYDQTLNQLLVEMDGIKGDQDVKILVVAATNRADMLDPALLRPGRFDRQVKVDLPDREGRLQILKIHVKNKPLGEEISLDKIAQETFGFSGADLENLANEAAILAFRKNKKSIEQEDFIEAIDKVLIGEKANKKVNKEDLERIAIHETGHALISELVSPESVAHVTIVSRGSALGYMRQRPDKDRYLYTKNYLEAQIMICLGGSVAEELVLGNKSSGSANDFKQASDLAKKIIYSGMSELGIISVEEISKAQVGEEVSKIISEVEEKTMKLLSEREAILLDIKEYLLANETITGDVFREKVNSVKAKKEAAS
ncbi:ATP-dependent metalloprotease FtsH [Desulfitispora alkaliphila]|uniref:AAA family ATPase n=1 Tax=Desulfitispora alkaliphila TaxID=622674 RepID=UPI003D1F1A3C